MDKELHQKAKDIHNEQSIEVRTLLCISATNTQIHTLEMLKIDIMNDAKRRCDKINNWIKSLENGSFGLRQNIEQYEKHKVSIQLEREL